MAADSYGPVSEGQTLWSIAREQLPVVILIAANHRYAILQNELRRFGVTEFGPQALALTELETGPGLQDVRIDALVAFLKTLTDARYEGLLAP